MAELRVTRCLRCHSFLPVKQVDRVYKMELHRFIGERMNAILAEWDIFALSLAPVGTMTHLALRDHAKEILNAIAADMKTYQSSQQQIRKSQGLAVNPEVSETAASVHGALRQESDFSLVQLSAEFRALRATVLRLWLPTVRNMSPETVESMVRFNEAIDQALAESIAAYNDSAEHTRELFLAILGHDLRAPLATMAMSAQLLIRKPPPSADQVHEIGMRIRRGSQLMSSMVDDLLGYTREKLGVGIPTNIEAVDLLAACQSALADATALHPETHFSFSAVGSLEGFYDSVRVTQLVTNLLKNASQYGEPGRTVDIAVTGHGEDVTIDVKNHGAVIPESSLASIFQALVQLSSESESDPRPRTSLGLGLYVARETALAHGGTISVRSNATEGTTFSVRLPKKFRTIE